MKVTSFPYGPLSSNLYLLEQNDEYVIVDPSVAPERFSAVLNLPKVISGLKAVLITHAHFDHIMYADLWKKMLSENNRNDVKFYLNASEHGFLRNPDLNCSSDMSADTSFLFEPTDNALASGIALFSSEPDNLISVINTPGHSPGSSCYLFEKEKILFSGDTLFCGSVGRTDLPKGSYADMKKSIETLKTIGSDYKVYPGHGPSTTILKEKQFNPYFN